MITCEIISAGLCWVVAASGSVICPERFSRTVAITM